MRLTKIKLAGFKSFVDPTTVLLKSNLVGIVGPNGSGKSNIIDAVRWVMGESSAKHLRGDSMADVIFNGSSTRKPVGQASIELVFDNSQGSLGGQYAGFNEISVKRQVNRDGQSHYYLNGSRCRRKDITDLFLGTGLGPRSYAIIEQGMISRLIEAKPEALRATIEEAAGISKYKERRRETETRIRHTQDNLNRVRDLRDELDKQLERLKRQAQTARRYQALKAEQRELEGQLLVLQWRQMDGQARDTDAQVSRHETALEAALAEQRALEAEIEQRRSAQIEANDHFNTVQAEYYRIGGDITSREQALRHAEERRRELEHTLAQVRQNIEQSRAHQQTDQARLHELENRLAELEPARAQADEAAELAQARLEEAEQAMRQWQGEWEVFNREVAEVSQGAQVERTRIEHLEQACRQLERRHQRLQEEFQTLPGESLEQEVQQLAEQVELLQAQAEEAMETLQTTQQGLAAQQQDIAALGDELAEARSESQHLRGRIASLEALQEAALGKDDGAVRQWLAQTGLQQRDRLAQRLAVAPGWERAVETVLDFHLEAVCVDDLASFAPGLQAFDEGALELIEDTSAAPVTTPSDTRLQPLAMKLAEDSPARALLAGVYCADDLDQALALRVHLRAGESIVLRDGSWLGRNWLRNRNENTERGGVLQREQALRELHARQQAAEQRVAHLSARLEQAKQALQQRERQRQEAQQAVNGLERQLGESRARLAARQARYEQVLSRRDRLLVEMTEVREQLEQQQGQIGEARARLEQALEGMQAQAERKQHLERQREELRQVLEQARREHQQARQQVQELRLEIQTGKTALESTRQSLQRAASQVEGLMVRLQQTETALADTQQPVAGLQRELDALLASRVGVEQRLGEARQALEELDAQLRQLNARRAEVEQRVQQARQALEQVRIDAETLKIRRQTLQEQLDQAGYSRQSIAAGLPEEAEPQAWEEKLEQVHQKIQRLGAINLAAIDEYQEQAQRKEHIEAQYQDLEEALNTLENAIRKIDRETRARFKETFDRVNDGLKRMFPKLFGGGQAYLELTGDDLLDTGVSIMARPPGKRVSNIHLLSGGEKALTAVALVFAIFELNPAPFCMLDEVDAPLDEANVGRFCDLVKEMSQRVQFIFITHNKATMEISTHLNGVTMHEPGVSRMVAVDVEEAVELAAV